MKIQLSAFSGLLFYWFNFVGVLCLLLLFPSTLGAFLSFEGTLKDISSFRKQFLSSTFGDFFHININNIIKPLPQLSS